MKAKRVLCSLLAALLLSIGATPAAAWEPPAGGFALEARGGWQQTELRWIPEGVASAFFAAVDDDAIDYVWTVQQVSNPGESPEVLTAVAAENPGVTAKELRAEGALVLTLKATANTLEGRFKISLSLDGAESQPIYIWLMDDSALQTALHQARELLANPGKRYAAAYIASLQTAADKADALYLNAQATPTDINASVAEINALVSSPALALTKYEFVNNLIPGWWKLVDLVTSPFQRLQVRFQSFLQSIGQLIVVTFTFDRA